MQRKFDSNGKAADKKTKHGYDFYEVLSALQKEIRRGNEYEAMFWAVELESFNIKAFKFNSPEHSLVLITSSYFFLKSRKNFIKIITMFSLLISSFPVTIKFSLHQISPPVS